MTQPRAKAHRRQPDAERPGLARLMLSTGIVLALVTIGSGVGMGLTADARSPDAAGGRDHPAISGAQDAPADRLDTVLRSGAMCGAPARSGGATLKPGVHLASATVSAEFIQSDPPLYDNLGTLTDPITTAAPLAQRYFDQGLRLAYAFNHAEARRAFRMAQRLDPTCAMCFWGEALVLGPNINAPMDEAAAAPALAALATAQQLAASATAREQALIAALARRYSADPTADRAALDAAYADAMAAVAAGFPDDSHIAVLAAEAMMDTQPWDYWEVDQETPKGRTEKIIALLEGVLDREPDHAGAIHLYIHMTEASTTPERAEPYADRLGRLMPGAGHMVHMPAHTYFRIGRYRDSLAANIAAVKADEAYLQQAEVGGIYAHGYYPHNIHFVVESARMAGAGSTAVEYADRLDSALSAPVIREHGWIQAIKVAPYFAHAQFSPPETALALAEPDGQFPFVAAMWRYMRAVAAAAQGDLTLARAEVAAIDDPADQELLAALADAGLPAPQVVAIARKVAEARIARAAGDLDAAVAAYRAAIEIEDTLPYMEPPFWYFPVRQSLGAVLLVQGDAVAAERAFRQALAQFPNNAWALYGLMQAETAQGKDDAATVRAFANAWIGERAGPSLDSL